MDRRTWVFVTVVAFLLGAKAYGQTPPPKQVPTISIYVSDMHCAHCAKKIASKLYTIKGVRSVVTNVPKGVAVITPAAGKQMSIKQLWETVEGIQFTPKKIVTPNGIFTKKPTA